MSEEKTELEQFATWRDRLGRKNKLKRLAEEFHQVAEEMRVKDGIVVTLKSNDKGLAHQSSYWIACEDGFYV